MKNKVTEKYLRKALGEHFAYMPKGEYRVNSSEKVLEFIFNPAKVSKKFIEACLDKDELYKYIKESTGKKVVMQFPLDESTDESMMTPTASMFTGKRTLQCDSEGKEILREYNAADIDINDGKRYKVDCYLGRDFRGLMDYLFTDDFEEVQGYIWEQMAKGFFITVKDWETGKEVRINPDDYDYETNNFDRVLDDLDQISPLHESVLTEADEEEVEVEEEEEVEEEPAEDEDEEELELNVDAEEEVEEDDSDESNISERYAELAQKTVYDSDGFMTDYTLYLDNETGRFICIFGDQDFYSPDDSDPDAEFEREAEAYEWFNSYEGIIDDEEEDEDFELNFDEEDIEEDPEDEEELELNVDEEEEVEEESLQLRTPVDEDYWFGGDGKMDIPERDDLESGEQEIEIRTDDVTQDNEDQNEEEQEEELNESLIDESDYVIVPRGKGKFVYCDRYGDSIVEIEVSTDGSIKVIEKNAPATLSTPDSVYEIKDEYQTMDEFDKDFKSYISDNIEYETLEEGKKFSFKDSYICQGCGNKLNKCTCDVKDDKLKEEATQPSNIGQHKRSSIDLMGDDNTKDSEMIKSLDKMVNEDETAEK